MLVASLIGSIASLKDLDVGLGIVQTLTFNTP